MSNLRILPRVLRAGFSATSSAVLVPDVSALSLEPIRIKERLFLGRRGAAERSITVREAAEPADDVGVQLGPFQEIGIAGRSKKRAAFLLVGHQFRMLERQVEKLP